MKATPPEKFPFDLGSSNDLPFLVGLINLTKGGPAELVISYAGQGDSGGITSVAIRQGPKKVRLPAPLQDQIEDWAWQLLGDSYPGWEINEGSSGEISINVQTCVVTHEHNWSEGEEE